MSEIEDIEKQTALWLQPLPDDSAPAGIDIEYDNDFLALNLAASGKPESQFGPAEQPDWRGAVNLAAGLFDKTRDLRVAIAWLRGSLRLEGYAVLGSGLALISGLIEQHWEHLHPLPDPDDGDPYARVNALAVLPAADGLMADLRDARIVEDRAVGIVRGRDVETALALPSALAGQSDQTRDQVSRMLAAGLAKTPALRGQCQAAVVEIKRLIALVNDKLGSMSAPDLRPVSALVVGVASLLPPEDEGAAGGAEAGEGGEAEAGASAGGGRSRAGLSGSVNSREEAVRALDLVCDYLERAEPANPAPLFLRRARALINHNFLQLMKVLAPDALAEVARVVGVDPDSVEEPGSA